jgi:hypothetical protein
VSSFCTSVSKPTTRIFAVSPKRINSGRGHSYRLDGEKVDGVTTVIGDGVPKPTLPKWAAGAVAAFAVDHLEMIQALQRDEAIDLLKGSPYRDRDRAAKRGTEVHNLAEKLIHGEEVDVPEELTGHVDSYIKFLDEWQVEPIVVEGVVFSRKHRYMGTLDLIGKLRGRTVLADIKTTRSGIFGEVALQLAAYRYAEGYLGSHKNEELPMPDVESCCAIWVHADGYDVVPVTAGPAQFRAFLYAQQVAAFCRTSRDLVGDVVTPEDWS